MLLRGLFGVRVVDRAEGNRGGRTVAEGIATTRDAEVCFYVLAGAGEEELGVGLVPFISLFMMTPVSGTMTVLPKIKLMVDVRVSASPDLSAVTWRC